VACHVINRSATVPICCRRAAIGERQEVADCDGALGRTVLKRHARYGAIVEGITPSMLPAPHLTIGKSMTSLKDSFVCP